MKTSLAMVNKKTRLKMINVLIALVVILVAVLGYSIILSPTLQKHALAFGKFMFSRGFINEARETLSYNRGPR